MSKIPPLQSHWPWYTRPRIQWLTALGWFVVAGGMGVLLRSLLIWPIEGLIYPYLLHTHSHLMLLGWAFNALFTALLLYFVPVARYRVYGRLWLGFQLALGGMLVFFPLQGYAAGSIAFSSLHVFLSYYMVWQLRIDLKADRSLSARLLHWALFFLVMSSLGPYVLGVLKARNLEATSWYNLSIYYYLHFLYNGWFIFGCLALLSRHLEIRHRTLAPRTAYRVLLALVLTTLGGFSLSTLWTNPPAWVWWVGAASAVLQIGVGFWLMGWIWRNCEGQQPEAGRWAWRLAVLAGAAFGLKLLLQGVSATPWGAQWAYEQRHIVIAYLHLVFIGIISFSLLAQAIGGRYITVSAGALRAFLLFFILSELLLVVEPLLNHFANTYVPNLTIYAWVLAVGLWLSITHVFVRQLWPR